MRKWINLFEAHDRTDALARAQAAGFDTSTIWYHGSNQSFDRFSYDFVGKGNDQLGSGFYFTTDRESAQGYAGSDEGSTIHAVFLRLKGEVSREDTLPRSAIRSIIMGGDPDDLYNFGDVDRMGVNAILPLAVDSYAELPAFDAMICLSNDFYRGIEGEFLSNFVKATGCNHATERNSDGTRHCVVFDPADIRSIDAEFLSLDDHGLLS